MVDRVHMSYIYGLVWIRTSDPTDEKRVLYHCATQQHTLIRTDLFAKLHPPRENKSRYRSVRCKIKQILIIGVGLLATSNLEFPRRNRKSQVSSLYVLIPV